MGKPRQRGDGKTDGAVDRQTRKGVVRREVETGRTIVPKPDSLPPASGHLRDPARDSVGGVTRLIGTRRQSN